MSPSRLAMSALLIGSALLLVLFMPVAAGIPTSPTNVSSLPGAPHQGDPIQLTIGGLWSDGCVPHYDAHHVQGAVITVVLTVTAEICGQEETPWAVTVALGELDAGAYDVLLSGALVETHPLFVAKESWYLPKIIY